MIGISREAARYIIHRALNELADESTESAQDARRIELERLDKMVRRAIQIKEESDDPKYVLAAIDRLPTPSSL